MKAELNKLGDAPRAYMEKLQESVKISMQTEEIQQQRNYGGKLSLNERFEKIQGARISQNIRGRGKTLRLIPRPKVAAIRR